MLESTYDHYIMVQDKDTPLHSAAEDGYTEMASLLINNGADIHSKGKVSIFITIQVYVHDYYMIYHLHEYKSNHYK